MSGFNVNPAGLNATGEYLTQQSTEINAVAESLKTIRNGMTFRFSGTSILLQNMIRLEAGVIDQAVKCENIGKALQYIAEQYKAADHAVANITDPVTVVEELVHTVTIDILKLFGLDDDYYRQKMGYEEMSMERQQEKLMDQYLSETCQNLLKDDRYSQETWNNASPEERRRMLEQFILEINSIMGTDVDRNVHFDDLGDSTRGQYDPDTNSVTINTRYLSRQDADSYMIMRTMIHEMRHCYQHTAVDHPEKFMVSQETRQQWAENFKNYKDPKKDGYSAYVTQPIEWDAKNFAGQSGDIAGETPVYPGSW